MFLTRNWRVLETVASRKFDDRMGERRPLYGRYVQAGITGARDAARISVPLIRILRETRTLHAHDAEPLSGRSLHHHQRSRRSRVIATPAADGATSFDVDHWLGGMGRQLAAFGFGSWHFHDRRLIPEIMGRGAPHFCPTGGA
jgi:hypothetical protein